MLDLHTHSTASDGDLTPTELVNAADAAELSAVALTDHDTVAGLERFNTAGRNARVRTVDGVEIACKWYSGSLHLVGLFLNADTPALRALLERIRNNREIRNRTIAARLNEMGVPIAYDDVKAATEDGMVGRPHFAAKLVEMGYCGSTKEAFDSYLARGCSAYVQRELPLPEEGIATLHAAGSVVIWAHPFGGVAGTRMSRSRQVARELVKHGLDAVEIHYCDYTPAQQAAAKRLAAEFNLLVSGGSDFHGGHLQGIKLGVGYGDLRVPDNILPPLEARAAHWKQVVDTQ